MILNVLIAILSAVGGSGLTVAAVNLWGNIRLKKMDIAAEERKQFVKEINELRDKMNLLFDEHLKLKEEHHKLKLELNTAKSKIST